MIRNNNHQEILNLSKLNVIPIINGLTDYSHPCQILGDFLTIQEKFKNYKNIKITWIGDFNNVLISFYIFKIYIYLDLICNSKKILNKQKKIFKTSK